MTKENQRHIWSTDCINKVQETKPKNVQEDRRKSRTAISNLANSPMITATLLLRVRIVEPQVLYRFV